MELPTNARSSQSEPSNDRQARRPRRRIVRKAISALLAAASIASVGGVLGSGTAHADTAGTASLMPNVPVVDGFNWAAPERAGLWADAWSTYNSGKAYPEQYDPAYVRPSYWKLNFNGCTSSAEWQRQESGLPTVNTYAFTSVGGYWGVTGNKCVVSLTFPTEAAYKVSLKVTTPTGQATTTSQMVPGEG